MHRQIALSYAIAGVAVAIAVVTAFGATKGLLEARAPAAGEPVLLEAAAPDTPGAQACAVAAEAPAPHAMASGREGALLADARSATAGDDVEVVYVDEPAPSRRGHDDDSDEDSDEDSNKGRNKRSDGDRAEHREDGRGERGEHDDD